MFIFLSIKQCKAVKNTYVLQRMSNVLLRPCFHSICFLPKSKKLNGESWWKQNNIVYLFNFPIFCSLFCLLDPVEASEKGNGTKLNDSDTINETIPQTDVTTKPITSVLILGLVTVKWTSRCRGEVIMNNLDSVPSLSAVCYNASSIQLLLKDLCENKKGCEGATKFSRSRDTDGGYRILAKQEITQCETLSVICKGQWSLFGESIS